MTSSEVTNSNTLTHQTQISTVEIQNVVLIVYFVFLIVKCVKSSFFTKASFRNFDMYLNCFHLKSVWWLVVLLITKLHFDSGLSDHDPYSRLQRCKKQNTSAPIILQRFQLILMEFGKWLKLVNLIHESYLHFTMVISIQGREPY